MIVVIVMRILKHELLRIHPRFLARTNSHLERSRGGHPESVGATRAAHHGARGATGVGEAFQRWRHADSG